MEHEVTAGQLSALIGRIYDCAITPGNWNDTLDQVRLALGAANASLCLIDVATSRQLFDITSNIHAPYDAALNDMTDAMYDMWGGRDWFLTTPLDRPTILSETIPAEQVAAARYYREWNRPQGLNDTLGLWLARDPNAFGLMGFRRLERDGPFGTAARDLATLLIPHLQRSAAINRLLDLAALERSTFAALFDTLSVPVLLVGGGLRLVHANVSARVLLDDGGQLRQREGQLSVVEVGANRALIAAIDQATADGAALARRGLSIPLRRADGSTGALHVLPLSEGDELRRSGALAAVFVARAMTPLVSPSEVPAALFDLTPTEARVFQHITAGRTITQTAATLGVEDSTVKTHLLRLYDKTGVRRQAELVHMAASLNVPVLH